ncbi:hypothetical protein ASF01_16025 [Stenotrophomonas sp. Leaf70]|uniref:sulfotransferase family protein n=1 Tax=Stenotrophomonas sp. Leaf70 TaxID=1736233 RepID=UPI0006F45B3B|nr:sulfotransferase [Stenotrophomonas sp. Leaf70]KQN95873.1 hypothetical protein ASF01_16025 [Stenotrophomonas sp. Leaf70]
MTSGGTPRVDFVVGGVQKAGTTALASFLGRHPGVVLPQGKEAHVFDAPDFDDGWDVESVNRLYDAHFSGRAPVDALHGDATPIYLLHPRFVERIGRYNPAMRWIILLRDPVDRALSQYHMERSRGHESLPLWGALLAESWRLAGHRDDFEPGSPLRHHSYRLRGDYAAQLDVLHRVFPPEQILTLRNHELARQPAQALARVHAFLGLPVDTGDTDYGRVFEGDYSRWPKRGWQRRLLRWWWRHDLARQARHGLEWE